MATITILPETAGPSPSGYRAISNGKQSVGASVGQALDAISGQMPAEETTLVVVQHRQPDQFFPAQQQRRLQELMTKWRATRDGGSAMIAEEQTELEALTDAEVRAAGLRATALLHELTP